MENTSAAKEKKKKKRRARSRRHSQSGSQNKVAAEKNDNDDDDEKSDGTHTEDDERDVDADVDEALTQYHWFCETCCESPFGLYTVWTALDNFENPCVSGGMVFAMGSHSKFSKGHYENSRTNNISLPSTFISKQRRSHSHSHSGSKKRHSGGGGGGIKWGYAKNIQYGDQFIFNVKTIHGSCKSSDNVLRARVDMRVAIKPRMSRLQRELVVNDGEEQRAKATETGLSQFQLLSQAPQSFTNKSPNMKSKHRSHDSDADADDRMMVIHEIAEIADGDDAENDENYISDTAPLPQNAEDIDVEMQSKAKAPDDDDASKLDDDDSKSNGDEENCSENNNKKHTDESDSKNVNKTDENENKNVVDVAITSNNGKLSPPADTSNVAVVDVDPDSNMSTNTTAIAVATEAEAAERRADENGMLVDDEGDDEQPVGADNDVLKVADTNGGGNMAASAAAATSPVFESQQPLRSQSGNEAQLQPHLSPTLTTTKPSTTPMPIMSQSGSNHSSINNNGRRRKSNSVSLSESHPLQQRQEQSQIAGAGVTPAVIQPVGHSANRILTQDLPTQRPLAFTQQTQARAQAQFATTTISTAATTAVMDRGTAATATHSAKKATTIAVLNTLNNDNNSDVGAGDLVTGVSIPETAMQMADGITTQQTQIAMTASAVSGAGVHGVNPDNAARTAAVIIPETADTGTGTAAVYSVRNDKEYTAITDSVHYVPQSIDIAADNGMGNNQQQQQRQRQNNNNNGHEIQVQSQSQTQTQQRNENEHAYGYHASQQQQQQQQQQRPQTGLLPKLETYQKKQQQQQHSQQRQLQTENMTLIDNNTNVHINVDAQNANATTTPTLINMRPQTPVHNNNNNNNNNNKRNSNNTIATPIQQRHPQQQQQQQQRHQQPSIVESRKRAYSSLNLEHTGRESATTTTTTMASNQPQNRFAHSQEYGMATSTTASTSTNTARKRQRRNSDVVLLRHSGGGGGGGRMNNANNNNNDNNDNNGHGTSVALGNTNTDNNTNTKMGIISIDNIITSATATPGASVLMSDEELLKKVSCLPIQLQRTVHSLVTQLNETCDIMSYSHDKYLREKQEKIKMIEKANHYQNNVAHMQKKMNEHHQMMMNMFK